MNDSWIEISYNAAFILTHLTLTHTQCIVMIYNRMKCYLWNMSEHSITLPLSHEHHSLSLIIPFIKRALPLPSNRVSGARGGPNLRANCCTCPRRPGIAPKSSFHIARGASKRVSAGRNVMNGVKCKPTPSLNSMQAFASLHKFELTLLSGFKLSR